LLFTVVRSYHRPFEIRDFYIERTVYFPAVPLISPPPTARSTGCWAVMGCEVAKRGRSVGTMTSESARAQTLAFQGLANSLVRTLLRTPLIGSAMGGRLITLYLVGRKSGKHYEIPVAYTRDGEDLLIGTPFGWGRNLRTGEPIDILLKGKRRTADVQVITDEAGVTAHYAAMVRDNRQFAKFNKIGIDADGNPNPADLRAAWAAGARGFRLTPR
jgi:hypothetical protein